MLPLDLVLVVGGLEVEQLHQIIHQHQQMRFKALVVVVQAVLWDMLTYRQMVRVELGSPLFDCIHIIPKAINSTVEKPFIPLHLMAPLQILRVQI